MDASILLGKILQRFADKGKCGVDDYATFGYIRETNKTVYVTREKGEDSAIPFSKILLGIEVYKQNPNLFDEGPGALREFDITHVTSPVWAMLHLLSKEHYH